MKKLLLLVLITPLVFNLSAQNLKGMLKKHADKAEKVLKGDNVSELTQKETGGALKEALNVGVNKAVDFLSAENGYYKSPYKILLPQEAQQVVNKVKNVPGFGDVEEKLVEKLNRAAETAAVKAKPIFVNAIKQMTFKDALNILMGEKDAATKYLESNTSKQLTGEFQPVIQKSLDEVNARSYWKTVVTAYNKIPFVKKTNPELDEYVTEKALLGMFNLVEKKELDIRKNKSSRSSDLMKKVFSKQD